MKDTKIFLITCTEDIIDSYGLPTGRKQTIVSHGIGNNTLKNYILPNEKPHTFAPKRDEGSGELYIEIGN